MSTQLTFKDINIRDPFILAENGIYYMYGTRSPECWGAGTGFDVYIGNDLINWKRREVFVPPSDFWADLHFWAPEVHKYRSRYYMFASFKSKTRCRTTQILVADSPEGPFVPHSDILTPENWKCLDGTFYLENGVPYMVFSHEWVQIKDGQICAVQLSDDLKHAVGSPRVLFSASSAKWALPGQERYVTDGPFMWNSPSGLIMLWSSFTGDGYCEAIARSDSGLFGSWSNTDLLYTSDGGHGMLFRDFSGKLRFVLHRPGFERLMERPVLLDADETVL